MLDVSTATRNPGTRYVYDVEQAIAPQNVCGELVRFDSAHLTGSYEAMENGDVEVEGRLPVPLLKQSTGNCFSGKAIRKTMRSLLIQVMSLIWRSWPCPMQ